MEDLSDARVASIGKPFREASEHELSERQALSLSTSQRGGKTNPTKPTNMKKKTLLSLACALVASAAIAADVETSLTTSSGTLTEYTPGSSFVVKESSGPVTYHYGKDVTYVTKSGKVLDDDAVRTRLKANVPVSVGYTTEGDSRVIKRVEIDDD
jgi:hypothetical protein